MFKIRYPQITDLNKLEEISCNNENLSKLVKNKLACLVQCFIPINLRFLPSIHIATREKNIIGFVILSSVSKPNNSWQIQDVFVFDEIRNEGIGEELLRYVLSVYGGQGIEHFLAEVDSQNFPALSLFHECGFRRCAKIFFYEKEVEGLHAMPLQNDFLIRLQTNSDLLEIEKLFLSSIPPDLRPALGRSKEYFKERKNSYVVIDKSRSIVIGWARVQQDSTNSYVIELVAAPGWTHLYEQFLNTIICRSISFQDGEKIKLKVKATDYLTELTELLNKSGFLPTEVKELLVKTIWQKVKEGKKKKAKIGVPSIAPT